MHTYGAVRELAPSGEQLPKLRAAVGAVRYAQNWALGYVKQQMDNKQEQSWSSFSLHTAWREHRHEAAPWYQENSKETYQWGCERVAKGLANWKDSKSGKRKGRKVQFPRFRKRGKNDSAYYTKAVLRSCGTLVHIPRIGEIALKESFTVPDDARITGVVVRPRAGRWFITFKLKEKSWVEPPKKPIVKIVGVDAGVGDRFATLSDETVIANPRFFCADEARLRHVSKTLRRKKKGSANRRKALVRRSVVQWRTANRRNDFIHKFTTGLVKSHDEIVIENLNLHGMKSNLNLGKSVSDVAWGEVRRQLAYKSSWYGTTLTIVSRWFPSSKQCPVCGYINRDLELSDRFWTCPSCGTEHDRDINAAFNLQDQSITRTGSSPGLACGDGVRRDASSAAVCETGTVVSDDNHLLAKVSK